MPILILRPTVRGTAINLSPVACEFGLGRVVGRVRRMRIELPPRNVHERAVREPNESVSVRRHGAGCGILRLGPVPTNPDRGCPDSGRIELGEEAIGRDPALIVRPTSVGELWVTPQESIDLLAHGRDHDGSVGRNRGGGSRAGYL
jgi:hypothetical protein